MEEPEESQSPWWKKLGWLILIWCAGVAALGFVAIVFKLLMRSAGLTN